MTPSEPRAVTGPPRTFLRLEGAVLLGLTVLLYAKLDRSWWLFVVLLLAPDVGLVGYARGSRVGAFAYNVFHTYLLPAVLAAIGVLAGNHLLIALSLIWFAHIGLDRALGYGLKFPEGFEHTHLGRIGRRV